MAKCAWLAWTTLLYCVGAHAGGATYTYDALGRLTSAVYGSTARADFAYDATGNRSSNGQTTPPSTAPTPTGYTLGAGSVTLTFTPPDSSLGGAITGYQATCNPGGLTATVPASATAITVPGLVKGTSYTCVVASINQVGASPASAQITMVGGTQSITFGQLRVIRVGHSNTVPVSASSGLAVSLSTTTPSVCAVAGSQVSGIASGQCHLVAQQAGNASFLAAPAATLNVKVLSIAAILVPIFGNDD
jgi:YD repeat-containing protein